MVILVCVLFCGTATAQATSGYTQAVDLTESYTVNVPNSQGGYTAILLKKSGNGFTGPQGKYFSRFPSVSQLQSVYELGIPNSTAVVATQTDEQIQQARAQFAQEQQQDEPQVQSSADGNSFTVNLPDSHGQFTMVGITKSGNGYTGPRGEYYSTFPTMAQLQAAYGPQDQDEDNSQVVQHSQEECMNFDKSIFKVGLALEVNMSMSEEPQYCVLYSLIDYVVIQKVENGFLITANNPSPYGLDSTVFLESERPYRQNQGLVGFDKGNHVGSAQHQIFDLDVNKLVGEWAYYVRKTKYTDTAGFDKEIYVFKEIDF